MIDHCLKRQTQDSDRKRTCPLFLKGNLAYFRVSSARELFEKPQKPSGPNPWIADFLVQ